MNKLISTWQKNSKSSNLNFEWWIFYPEMYEGNVSQQRKDVLRLIWCRWQWNRRSIYPRKLPLWWGILCVKWAIRTLSCRITVCPLSLGQRQSDPGAGCSRSCACPMASRWRRQERSHPREFRVSNGTGRSRNSQLTYCPQVDEDRSTAASVLRSE